MKNGFVRTMEWIDRGLKLTLNWVCIALFIAMTCILSLNIFVRFVPIMSMHWFDEILELLYGSLIFYGAAIVWINHSHFSVGDWISKYLKSVTARVIYRLLVELLSLVFIVIFFKYALDLTLHTEERTTAFAMSRKWLYACMPISGAIMLIYSIKNMFSEVSGIINPRTDTES